MVVDEVMTREPTTVSSRVSIGEALSTLKEVDARHLPVVDGGELVGILSDRDLLELQNVLDNPDADTSVLQRAVSAYMSSDVASVTPETELTEAVDIMLERRVGALPVLQTETETLVGIVSYVDVLKAAREFL
jgi:acetoin utilization protein AcuB